MDLAFVIVTVGFLVVGGIIFFILVPMISRFEERVRRLENAQNSHSRVHEKGRDEEQQRLHAIAVTIEALKGKRYAILRVTRSFGVNSAGERTISVAKVISDGQQNLPIDSSNLRSWEADDLRNRLGIVPGHDLRELRWPNTILVFHPAHFVPTEGLVLPDYRIVVISGSDPKLVPTEPLDLAAVAASLGKAE